MKDDDNIVDISKSELITEAIGDMKEGESISIVLTGTLTKRKKDGAIQLELEDAELEEPGETDDDETEDQPKAEDDGPTGVDYVISKNKK